MDLDKGFCGKGGFPWHQAVFNVGSGSEDFADSTLGWPYDLWAPDSNGAKRSNFMNENMAIWLNGMLP